MLNKVIPYIDRIWKDFSYLKSLGLAETIKNPGEDGISSPGIYAGKDEYIPVNLEGGSGYHRMTAERSVNQLEDNLTGCAKVLELVYPMAFVACVKPDVRSCDQFLADSIANSIAFKLSQVKPDRELKAAIQVMTFDIELKSILTDRNKIWDEEYQKVDYSIPLSHILISVQYEIRIKASTTCLNIIEC